MQNTYTTTDAANTTAAQQDQCPHKYISRDGGGNWEWIYFATEEQAQDVIAWIREGGSTKFSSGRAHYNGHTPDGTHCVHAHYDNERRVPHQRSLPTIRWNFNQQLTRLRTGDLVRYDGRPVRVERVTPTAAYIALPVEPRTFTTLMGQTVTVKAKPKCVAISANSEIPVLNRRAA